MKIRTVLILMAFLSALAQARDGVLVSYEGNTHRIVKRLHANASRPAETAGQLPNYRMRPVTQRRARDLVRVRLLRQDGSEELMDMVDPRIMHAPMAPDGGGHETVILKPRGAYVIPVADSASITAMEIELPQLNVGSDRRLSQ